MDIVLSNPGLEDFSSWQSHNLLNEIKLIVRLNKPRLTSFEEDKVGAGLNNGEHVRCVECRHEMVYVSETVTAKSLEIQEKKRDKVCVVIFRLIG